MKRKLYMKKNIFVVALFMLASASQLSAQMTDRLVPHFGYMYTLLTMENADFESAPFPLGFNAISIGTYYTLAQTKDIVSVGLDPNLNFGLNFSNTGNVNWYLQAPIFVMGRLGANSTSYNTQNIGLGAGLGMITSYMSFKGGPVNVKELYSNPAAVIEGTVNSRGSNITGRIMFSLAPAKGTGDLFAIDGNFRTRIFGVGLIYGF